MTAEDTNRDILTLSQDWANAERVSDASRLAELLADEFVGIGPRGFMLTKEEWIGGSGDTPRAHCATTLWRRMRSRCEPTRAPPS